MIDRGKFTPEEIGEKESYGYYNSRAISAALEELGYGDSKKSVDAFYLDGKNSRAVGVLRVTPQLVEDHIGDIYRGIDQIEALAQTWVLLRKFNGITPDGSITLFDRIEGFEFLKPVFDGATLNMVVEASGYGEVRVGSNITSRGVVIGKTMAKEQFERYIGTMRAVQKKATPAFPFIG